MAAKFTFFLLIAMTQAKNRKPIMARDKEIKDADRGIFFTKIPMVPKMVMAKVSFKNAALFSIGS